MTIASIKNKVVFGCDGTNTIFSFDFKVFKEEHLKVYIVDGDIETLLTLNTDYAVSGLSEDSGGKVMLTTPPSNGLKLVIVRELPPVQETSFRNQGPFFPEIHESAFDQVVMLIQQMMNAIGSTDGTNSRALFLGLADTDGQGAYRAKGNRIANLGDPINDTDAARVIDLKPFADSAQQAAQDAQQSSQKASEDAAKALDSAQRAEDAVNSIDTSTFYTKTETDAAIDEAIEANKYDWWRDIDVGTEMDWNRDSLPNEKWLRLDGATFDPVMYPDLAALGIYKNNKLPNVSNRYIRYIGNETKYQPYQLLEDTMQRIVGSAGNGASVGLVDSTSVLTGAFKRGAFKSKFMFTLIAATAGSGGLYALDLDNATINRTSDENRPKTIMIKTRIVKALP